MNDLIKIEKGNISTVFEEKGLNPLIDKIKQEVENFVPDVLTTKGRAEIKALAHKITRSKTYIDDVGKTYVTELKKIPKTVDAERKRMRDELDLLRVSVRKPLIEWEEKEEQRKEEKKLADEKGLAHDNALVENYLFNKQKELEAKERVIAEREEALCLAEEERILKLKIEQEKKERIEREEQLKKEAAENAKREAEENAKRVIENARLKLVREKQAREQAEFEKEEAIKAEKERAKQEAVRVENERLEKERIIKENEERKVADKTHRKEIEEEAMQCFMRLGYGDTTASNLVTIIAQNKIEHVCIKY